MQTSSETFGDKLVMLLIDKLAIGLLLLGIAFLLNRILERFKGREAVRKEVELLRDRTELDHLRRQIEELYSPLLGVIHHSGIVYRIMVETMNVQDAHRHGEIQQYFVETHFIPINEKIATLLREKIHLLETDTIPASFQQFLSHQSYYETLHRLWKEKGVESHDRLKGSAWPDTLEQEAAEALGRLRREYNKYRLRIRTG